MEQIQIYCVFPDRTAAIQLGQFLVGKPELEEFEPDGWWINPETGERTYWCIDVVFGTGEVWQPIGEPDVEGNQPMERVPGFHINGLWQGPEKTLPAQLAAFRVFPTSPACVFG